MPRQRCLSILFCLTLGSVIREGDPRNIASDFKPNFTSASLILESPSPRRPPLSLLNFTNDALSILTSVRNELLDSDANRQAVDKPVHTKWESSRFPRLNLTSGMWNGRWLEVPEMDTEIETFLGVRFAEPPIGHLRFKHPLPRAYDGEQNATVMGPACIQRDEFFIRRNMSYMFHPMSEDCLHVNIYRPKNARNLPIAVHYFGGSFYGGFNGHYIHDPEQLVAQENVIVVTANYRVGPMGFMFLNNSHAPGNAGFYDMVLAARFVKENAEAIGGDPDRFTLWGQSAGAIAMSMLMSSPLTEGLFTRVILQSGSAPSSALSLHMNSVSNGIYAASVLGCHNGTDGMDEHQADVVAACMKRIGGRELFQTLQSATGDQFLINFQAMAGIDDLIPVYPFRGSATKLNAGLEEVLIGTVMNEGGMFADGALERTGLDTPSAENFLGVAWFMLKSVLNVPVKFVRKAVFTYIREESEDLDELHDSMATLFGDLLFECPADLYSTLLNRRGVKVFRFLWAHRPTTSAWPLWVGPTHYDDIGFTMGSQVNVRERAEKSGQATHGFLDCYAKGMTEAEESLLHESMSMIGNFLRSG